MKLCRLWIVSLAVVGVMFSLVPAQAKTAVADQYPQEGGAGGIVRFGDGHGA